LQPVAAEVGYETASILFSFSLADSCIAPRVVIQESESRPAKAAGINQETPGSKK
jgi:hypothetical protein